MAVMLGQFAQGCFAMERRVIQHQQAFDGQGWEKMVHQPVFNHARGATSGKELRRHVLTAPPAHNQVGAAALDVARPLAPHPLAARRPGVRVVGGMLEAAFVEVNDIISAQPGGGSTKFLQVINAYSILSFCVPQRFFYECRGA